MGVVSVKPVLVPQVTRVTADLSSHLQQHLALCGHTGHRARCPAKCSLNDNKRTNAFAFLNEKGRGEECRGVGVGVVKLLFL